MSDIGRFLSLFLLVSHLPAGISGITTTETGAALPLVAVIHASSGEWCLSDESGRFYLNYSVVPGDTLYFKRYGYHNLAVSVPLKDLRISLYSENIALPGVLINGSYANSAGNSSTGTRTSLDRLTTRTWLNRQPGLSLRSYGGAASNLTLTLNGGSAVHTKVLVEGVDLTDPLMGQSDLSQLPLNMISAVAVDAFPGVVYGSGAVDGSVNLSTQPLNTRISASSGNYGHRALDFNWHVARTDWVLDAGGGTFKETGDYPCAWRDDEVRRENNAMRQEFYFARGTGLLKQRYTVNAYHLQTWQERGLAGLVYSPTPAAGIRDHLHLSTISVGRIFTAGLLNARYNHRSSSLEYRNPTYHLESNHATTTDQLELILRWRPVTRLKLFALIDGKHERVASSDAGRHQRNTAAGALQVDWEIRDWIMLAPALRCDYSPDLYRAESCNIDFILSPMNRFSISGSSGTAFRYPTFSDLYWSVVGNPALQAEHTVRKSLMVKYESDDSFAITLGINNYDSRNLIRWQPGVQYWRPVNIARVKRTAVVLQSGFNPGRWQISGNCTYLETRDVDLKKSIRYAPNFSSEAGIFYLAEQWQAGIQGQYTGRQIYIYDYPEDRYLDDYLLLVISGNYRFKIWGQSVELSGSLDNLTNIHYMTVYGYPEPGRSARFALEWKFN